MQHAELVPVDVGDRVTATGLLRRDGSSYCLVMRGEGVYGEFFNAADDFAVLPVDGLIGAQQSGMVTVRGVWTGEGISEAIATRGGRGVAPFDGLREDRFADVDGVRDRSAILRREVLDACDMMRGGALVAFLAARGQRGWFGLASAVDVTAVRARLEPLLGRHLHVVRSEWSLDQVHLAEDQALASEPDPYEFGTGWDADGRFRARVLVRRISPRLASVVNRFPADILHVEAWVKHAGPAHAAH
ncbi:MULTISPECIES: hypothetical protein [Microbacterium]|uniref:hypothetical protein n=1 Tax=Microbacterium TaxID=33882 RepID=UPI00277D195D|nr:MULTISPECIES: hypothetical protein [Microbacterium]MDQ1084875.1 hypothetical protein [Microbacterium sp. SORGH_AS_0344]MDQ1169846.1 hypothetical protein [Microbacterium proteolyticum]